MNLRLSVAARHLGEIEFARVNLDMHTGKPKGHAREDPLFASESSESLAATALGIRCFSTHPSPGAQAGERAISEVYGSTKVSP